MSSGSVPADIASIVDDLKDVSWKQVVFEAVTNSLQANATEINIDFTLASLDVSDKRYVDAMTVEDNGDGFTQKNTESFQKYRSTHKRHLGAKGIGRFLYLKIFEQVNIKSLDKNINFVIDKDIEVKNSEDKLGKTIINFKRPKKEFFINFEDLEQKLRDHFIAYFKLNSTLVTIKLFENRVEKGKIKSSEIPTFKTKKFKIRSHEFALDYVFDSDDVKEYDGYYCAGSRVVIKNSIMDPNKKLKAFNNVNILFLLSSPYFDANVNDLRDDFSIMPVQTKQGSLMHDTSWKDIREELANQIKMIAKENDIDIETIAKKNLQEARKEAPFLAFYLDENEEAYASEKLIKDARKRLEEDKNILRKQTKKTFTEEAEKLLGIVTQAELAEYIFDRQKKIEMLKTLATDKALEKEIHNLFMKKYTKDEDNNHKSNNLWLFDDRFMTYDKVFSESQLKDIFPDLYNNIDRPDIISIVSNTFKKEDITDIVLIELKRPSEKITPAEAQRELRSYADYINQSRQENKIRVWAYAFLKFDESTERDLRLDEYNQIPTHSTYPIYYKFSNTTNIIINFMDYEAIAYDADTRNNTFMKILSGNTINGEDD